MPDIQNYETEEFIREITKHQQMLVAFIRSLLPGSVDPRDVLQEVNITLWKKKSQYKMGTNFKSWAFTIAKFHVLNERRKLKRNQHFVFDEDIVEDLSRACPLNVSMLDDQLSALRNCMAKLREKDRSLLRMRYTSGVSIEQYAQTNGKNAGTIRAILRKLRIGLRSCIGHQLRKETV